MLDHITYYIIISIFTILAFLGFRSIFKALKGKIDSSDELHILSIILFGIASNISFIFFLINVNYSLKHINQFELDNVSINKVVKIVTDKNGFEFKEKEFYIIKDLQQKFKFEINDINEITKIKNNDFYIEEKIYQNIFQNITEYKYNIIFNKNNRIKIEKI